MTENEEEETDEMEEWQENIQALETLEFDSSSDQVPEEDAAIGNTRMSRIKNDATQVTLAPEANSLLGAVSRFGRAICFNHKIVT